jgi:hypothetical protein
LAYLRDSTVDLGRFSKGYPQGLDYNGRMIDFGHFAKNVALLLFKVVIGSEQRPIGIYTWRKKRC